MCACEYISFQQSITARCTSREYNIDAGCHIIVAFIYILVMSHSIHPLDANSLVKTLHRRPLFNPFTESPANLDDNYTSTSIVVYETNSLYTALDIYIYNKGVPKVKKEGGTSLGLWRVPYFCHRSSEKGLQRTPSALHHTIYTLRAPRLSLYI